MMKKRLGWKVCVGVWLVLICVVAWRLRIDVLVAYAFCNKKEGDLLFQVLPHDELSDAIEGVTGSYWTHCGILVWEDGRWQVAEALGYVRYTPLWTWVFRGRSGRLAVCRVHGLNAAQWPKAAEQILLFLGAEYDIHYAPDDSAIYCSELIYKVFDRALGIQLGKWERLGDLNWQPYEALIRRMEKGELPLDREMVTPVSVLNSERVDRIFTW